jgi:AraC-like DNA-binding protein
MFEAKFHKPDKTVSWLVKQFETIRSSADTETEDKFVPRTDASLVFHFKMQPFITFPFHAKLKPFFVAPLVSRANTIKISGELDTFIVTCHPSTMSAVFGIDMSPSPSLSIQPPHATFFPLWLKLNTCKTTQQRISCFSKFIKEFQPEPYGLDLIDTTFNNISNFCITKPLPEILRETPKSLSVIQRQFLKRVGISPKTLARIVRVNYLLDKINREKAIDFQALVFDGNYYDQAHFINDFKAITGETPGYFFRRNLALTNVLSGKNY